MEARKKKGGKAMQEELQELHKEIAVIKDELAQMQARNQERFVSPVELAEIMGCSRNTISNKLKSGDIYATRKLGDPRIPMSQFYKTDPVDLLKRKTERPRKAAGAETMENLIFGER